MPLPCNTIQRKRSLRIYSAENLSRQVLDTLYSAAIQQGQCQLGTRKFYCRRNGCEAYTAKRALQIACDSCGAPRHGADDRPPKQTAYLSLTFWQAYLLGDPIIGKSILENTATVRQAADDGTNGIHDHFHGNKRSFLCDRGLLDGVFVPLKVGTNGFQSLRQNGFKDWLIIATPLRVSPD